MQFASGGDLQLARAALEPFLTSGGELQTLFDLARICTEQGDLDQALLALQRAESMEPANEKVWRLTAKLLSTCGRHREEVVYRRRLALARSTAPAQAYIDLIQALFRSLGKGKQRAPNESELQLLLSRFEAAPDVDDRMRLEFAGLYYLMTFGSPEALRLYNRTMPRQPHERDVTAALLSLTRWSTQHELPMPRANEEGQPGRRPTVHQLDDVLVFPALDWIPVLQNGAVMASGYQMASRLFRAEAAASPLMLYRGSHAELRLPRELPVESAPALLVGGSDSYYDNLVHHVGSLAVAESLGVARDLPLVILEGDAPGLGDALDLLGYEASRRIGVAAAAPRRFVRLHVPSRLAAAAEWIDPLLARWYRTKFTPSRSPVRKLYVDEQGVGGVAVANEADVADLLLGHGYERIEPMGLSLSDRIDSFSGASHIVAATNEGLTHLLFCPEGARVIELRARHWVASGGRMHFDRLAEACGHRYSGLECALAPSPEPTATSVVVDLDALRAALEDAAA